MAESKSIKVNELEIGARLRDEDRLLVLVDDVNNEVKTIAKENVLTSLISTVENNLLTNNGGLFVDGNTIAELVEALKNIQQQQSDEIGRPIPTLSNTLLENEVWLEGATVSRTEYDQLFEIYGETYGVGDGETTFKLPDFRNRAIWGASNFGYIEAGLPNITGSFRTTSGPYNASSSGAFTHSISGNRHSGNESQGILYNFDASRSSSVYGKSNTVQPPAIKVRVKTRFK